MYVVETQPKGKVHEWYKPSNYTPVSSFNLPQVIRSLWVRHLLHHWIDSGYPINENNCEPYRKIIKGEIDFLAQDRDSFENMGPYHAVSLLGCNDIAHMSQQLNQAGWELPVSSLEIPDNTPYDLLFKTQDDEDTTPSLTVSINLEASNDQILNQLKGLLLSHREIMGIPSFDPNTLKGTSTGHKDWVTKFKKNRILDIVDICLWGKINNIEISDTFISKVVYSDRYVGGSDGDVRKTHMPMAKQAVNRRRIDALMHEIPMNGDRK